MSSIHIHREDLVCEVHCDSCGLLSRGIYRRARMIASVHNKIAHNNEYLVKDEATQNA